MLTSKRSLVNLSFSLTIVLFSCTNNNRPVVPGVVKDTVVKSDSGQNTKPIPQQASPLSGAKDEISGTYVIVNEPVEADKCSMTITISKDTKGYSYTFTSDSRSLKGKLSVEANDEKNGHYITLEGIEWSEYEGPLDDEGEPTSKEPLDLPVGIGALLQNDTISLQNYGNSMNYYLQLADCGKKYIVLKKQ